MNFHVHNDTLSVGQLDIFGISSSSLVQVGDTGSMHLYAMFDTPPESVIVSPFVPLPPPRNAEHTD